MLIIYILVIIAVLSFCIALQSYLYALSKKLIILKDTKTALFQRHPIPDRLMRPDLFQSKDIFWDMKLVFPPTNIYIITYISLL